MTSEAPPGERRWAVAMSLLLLAVTVGSILWIGVLPPRAPTRLVRYSPDTVILAASDLQDIGWGLRASGTNGSGVWRLFSGHNELVLAFLNVTLWVDADAGTAESRFAAVAGLLPYPPRQGNLTGADESRFWSPGSCAYAGILVRRYNVVFVLSAYLESSWCLTQSDLGSWAGWQLTRIEADVA